MARAHWGGGEGGRGGAGYALPQTHKRQKGWNDHDWINQFIWGCWEVSPSAHDKELMLKAIHTGMKTGPDPDLSAAVLS